jgi:hypothetical protein
MSVGLGSRHEPVDLFRHLPAIYEARRDAGDPFSLLVKLLSESHATIEEGLSRVPEMLDPRTAPAGMDRSQFLPLGEERTGFLEYLAGWVALDPAMLGGHDPSPTTAGGASDSRTRVLRHLVENAAPLQAARGTVSGVRYLLEVLFDAEVEILEWHWPTPFQLGVAASLGADTLLIGEPPLDRCVTLIWDSPRLRQTIASLGGTNAAFNLIELGVGARKIGAVIVSGTMGLDVEDIQARMLEQVRRLHAILRCELPAHVASYVGFRPVGRVDQAELVPFIVGDEKTILGRVQIQRRS